MHEVLIIGGGLTGLALARALKKEQISFRVVEARDRTGGRIQTARGRERGTPIEMGATWFGDKHIYLNDLLAELSVPKFHQRKTGAAWFESMSFVPPQQFDIPDDGEPYYRIQGGTMALIRALVREVGLEQIDLNAKVTEINEKEDHLEIKTADERIYRAGTVVSTLPPRLLAQTVRFTPTLPGELLRVMRTTHTWMSESIKFGVEYDRPFWLERGYSGTAYSQVGPITEMYDHCDAAGKYFALKGFLNPSTRALPAADRRAKVLEQLGRFFGPVAAAPLAYEEAVWADQPLTHVDYGEFVLPRQHNGHPHYASPQMNGRLWTGGTETSPHFGGYMEGAVYSAVWLASQLVS